MKEGKLFWNGERTSFYCILVKTTKFSLPTKKQNVCAYYVHCCGFFGHLESNLPNCFIWLCLRIETKAWETVQFSGKKIVGKTTFSLQGLHFFIQKACCFLEIFKKKCERRERIFFEESISVSSKKNRSRLFFLSEIQIHSKEIIELTHFKLDEVFSCFGAHGYR